ncbi:Nucleolar protein 16 [Diatrype stigma]|uniref:Nucleolar protein 16 n=1 Tax=Diatrype stigma TaxID=117547 RepID=A0AAN9UP08_9PEZI
MGRDLQKRKRRSSRPAVKQHASSKPHRLLNPLGNDIIAKNWDKKQTTTQNYRRLGLVGRLKAPTGGAEPDKKKKSGAAKKKPAAADSFAIAPSSESVVSEVRVERDENGKIVRILEGNASSARSRRANPLRDPLNVLDSDSEDNHDDGEGAEEWGGIDEDEDDDEEEDEAKKIVRQLEAQANRPVERRPRNQSQREREWVEALVRKHGDDTRAMVRDRVLNPMQQTEADIARRIRKWKKETA